MSDGDVSSSLPDACSTERMHRRYELLSRLPLLFTSGLQAVQARTLALRHLKTELQADAATLYLIEPGRTTLRMWVTEGGATSLQSEVIPIDRGIVGWVIQQQQSVRSEDAGRDPRFFKDVDERSGYETRSMVCVPLTGTGHERIGALQVMNKTGGSFTEDDLELLECLAPLIVMGIESALFRERAQVQQQRLEALKRKRDEMLTVISHEFRTPLGVIQATSDLIVRGALSSEQQQKSGERLRESVERLTRLVTEIRNSNVVSKSTLVSAKKELSVSAACESVVSELTSAANAVRKLSIQHELPSDLVVMGDEVLFSLALRNIVHNAIRFTPDGGSVRVTGRRGMGVIVVEVADTGIGIPTDQLDAVFDSFYEVGSSMAHSSGSLQFRSGGLGLGLTTAKSILEAHGAVLEVQSVEGAGTTVRIRMQGA